MSWVDIVIISLVALLAVAGVIGGIKKSTLSLVAFLVAFIISFFAAKVVTEAMLGVDAIRFFVFGAGLGDSAPWSLANWIYKGFSESAMTDTSQMLFYKPIIDIISQYGGYSTQFTQEMGFALYSAFLMLSAIVGVGLFLVTRLLLCIVTMIVKSFFGKKKSPVQRLTGMLVGAVRGFCWALALTIAFSTVGGLTIYDKEKPVEDQAPSAFEKIEREYENSVVGKYVNQWAYSIRNAMFLPDINMYGRLVDLSGLNVREEDKDDETKIIGAKLDLLVDIYNLNYKTDSPYTTDKNTGLLVEPADPQAGRIDPAEYANTGFDAAVKAIMDYNTAAAEKIRSGGINDMSETEVALYKQIVQDGADSIYDLWLGAKRVITDLGNYSQLITDGQKLSTEEAITDQNGKLKAKYDEIVSKFEKLKIAYVSLKPTFGDLTFELPELVVLTVPEAA